MTSRDSPIVYICSPYSGDTVRNTEMSRRYSRLAVERGFIPLAPHLLLPQYISEESERELAISMDLRFLEMCGGIWVCGETISKGMEREIEKAKEIGLPVRRVREEELCSLSMKE